MKKRLFSIAMAVAMCLSVGTSAFAAEASDSADENQIIGQCDAPTEIKCDNKVLTQSSPADSTDNTVDENQIIGQCDAPTEIKCANKVLTQSSPADSTDNTVDENQIIGQYDGPAFKIDNNNKAMLQSIGKVRVNSYATYSKDDGVQVHIELYVPWFEFQNPMFTSMSGNVTTTVNNTSDTKSFFETASQTSTISTDVSTGVKGSSGDKGKVSFLGKTTGVNINGHDGDFGMSYPITIP